MIFFCRFRRLFHSLFDGFFGCLLHGFFCRFLGGLFLGRNETPQVARVCKAKAKRQRIPEFGLTLLVAAHRVLREAKKPLTCQEIVDRAFKKKYHRSHGATPANTINAAMTREIKAKGRAIARNRVFA